MKKQVKEKKDKISIGKCGEYFTAGELERNGFTVALPLSNTPSFDILAINKENVSKQFAIQVKTTTSKKNEWTLSEKSEKIKATNVFYVFVKLNGNNSPDYFIVPSSVVAKYAKKDHEIWLRTPGKNGQKHKNNNLRKFRLEDNNKYHNNWSLIK